MTGEERTGLRAFLNGSVRRVLDEKDVKSGTWDPDRVFQLISATATLLATILVALQGISAAPAKGTASEGLKTKAQEVSRDAVKEAHRTGTGRPAELDSWPLQSIEDQLELTRELVKRAEALDLSGVPYGQMLAYAALLPPVEWPNPGDRQDPPVQDVGPQLISLALLEVTESLKALAIERDRGDGEVCCCCQQPAPVPGIIVEKPVSKDATDCCKLTGAALDGVKAANEATTAAANSAKAAAENAMAAANNAKIVAESAAAAATKAVAAVTMLAELRKAAADKPFVVTYRVPMDAYSECQTISEFGTVPGKQLIVQFKASRQGAATSIEAFDCRAAESVSSLDRKGFQSLGVKQFKTGEAARVLNVSLIGTETVSVIPGIWRKPGTVVISAWIARK
jgi:hypothetical protein